MPSGAAGFSLPGILIGRGLQQATQNLVVPFLVLVF
ncbi:hypothetical protein X758_16905 [Mesorhizobium sp. LSHC416B00]|nr:hypothetical protein X761_14010 [Mesorhizobium sp. LSHC424B00]ESX70518.1 hypothetical protein X758_16905 [Mesorhizobium sp. LSHC416B00]